MDEINQYKSYGEKQIANFLKFKEINFTYEKQIKIIDKERMERLWYPDFYLEDYDVIIEYFGMKGNKNYDNGTNIKKKAYYENGYKVIPIYPETFKKNWKRYINIELNKLEKKVEKNLISLQTMLKVSLIVFLVILFIGFLIM